MNNDLWTTEEVAAYFRTVPATVRYWRHVGKGPRSLRVGRRVLYRRSDVDTWAERALTEPHGPESASRQP